MSSINSASNAPVILEGVYYVDSPDMAVGHIAIRPTFTEKQATWDDTSNGMVVHLDNSSSLWKQLKNRTPNSLLDRIDIVFQKNKTITLQYLTLDVFNKKLKSQVVGSPTFSNTEELQHYYLTTDFLRLE